MDVNGCDFWVYFPLQLGTIHYHPVVARYLICNDAYQPSGSMVRTNSHSKIDVFQVYHCFTHILGDGCWNDVGAIAFFSSPDDMEHGALQEK